jgi:hypothetical protein
VDVQPDVGRRRHQGEATKGEGDATPDLLNTWNIRLKADETLEKCI